MYSGSACGVVDGQWCANGSAYTSGEMRKVQNIIFLNIIFLVSISEKEENLLWILCKEKMIL